MGIEIFGRPNKNLTINSSQFSIFSDDIFHCYFQISQPYF